QDDHACLCLVRLLVEPVNEENASRFAVLVHGKLAHDSVSLQGESSGPKSGRQSIRNGIPERPHITTAPATAAVMACRQAVNALRSLCRALGNHLHAQPQRGRDLLHDPLTAIQCEGRQILAVWKVWDIL